MKIEASESMLGRFIGVVRDITFQDGERTGAAVAVFGFLKHHAVVNLIRCV